MLAQVFPDKLLNGERKRGRRVGERDLTPDALQTWPSRGTHSEGNTALFYCKRLSLSKACITCPPPLQPPKMVEMTGLCSGVTLVNLSPLPTAVLQPPDYLESGGIFWKCFIYREGWWWWWWGGGGGREGGGTGHTSKTKISLG